MKEYIHIKNNSSSNIWQIGFRAIKWIVVGNGDLKKEK
jgi:hypothetical protein